MGRRIWRWIHRWDLLRQLRQSLGTMVIADRLIAITPQGDVLELLDDGNHEANARAEAEYATAIRSASKP